MLWLSQHLILSQHTSHHRPNQTSRNTSTEPATPPLSIAAPPDAGDSNETTAHGSSSNRKRPPSPPHRDPPPPDLPSEEGKNSKPGRKKGGNRSKREGRREADMKTMEQKSKIDCDVAILFMVAGDCVCHHR